MNHGQKMGGATLVALAITLLGCGEERVVRFDEGKLCVHGGDSAMPPRSGPDLTSPADTPIYVSVRLGCVSACIEDEQASCAVTRRDDELLVHSVHAYDPPDARTGCIALCGTVEATCESDPLPPGAYTLRHGERSYPLVVPTTNERSCF